MKPTHQLKGGGMDVVAWQYTKKAPVPAWVFRNFHRLGDEDVLTHQSGKESVKLTNWIVALEGSAIVLTNEEFEKCFNSLQPISTYVRA